MSTKRINMQQTWAAWVRLGHGPSGDFIEDLTIYDCSDKPRYRRATVTLDEAGPTGKPGQEDKPQSLSSTDRERKYREALALILPLAKGYAAAHPVGSNQAYVDEAEEALALPTEQDKGWLRTGNEAQPTPEAQALEEDAERWRALVASDRFKIMGTSGFDWTDNADPKPKPGNLHFGLEVWDKHAVPADAQGIQGRALLLNYVEELVRRRTLSAPSTGTPSDAGGSRPSPLYKQRDGEK